MAIVSGLEFGSCFQGDCFVLWAAAPRAPISHVADARGLAVLWGDAISGPGLERVDALTLRSRWQAREGDSPQPYDGFYAGVVFDFEQGLTVGADLLGLFPVYYCTAGDTLLIGSSPEMFRHHPAFQFELDPVGLVGILLTNGLLNGQTLSKGVQRLSPGHLLVWRPGKSPRELRQYEIPLSTRYSGLPLQAHVEILDDAIRDAMKRHVPRGEGCGFLLSGGLDSRLLGGYLAETGIEVHALTWGLPSDIEMQCAVAVARTLRLPHRRFEPSPEAYVTGAKLQANYEQLANGFNQIRLWDIVPRLADLGTRSVTGLMLDRVITPHTNYESPPSGDPLECALALQNELGIPPEVLRNLLRSDVFGDLVPEIVAELRREYVESASSDFRRAWRFELGHRARFHVGSAAHRFSFGSWPVLVALDRKVLDAAAGIPAASLEDRMAERELLCNRFPELASLPLDRGSIDALPLRPKMHDLLARHLRRRLRSLRRLFPPGTTKGRTERRYWYRTTDLDGPGWKGVRGVAETHRKRIYALFRQDAFDAIVPAAVVPFQSVENTASGSAVKLLLGTMLWAENHL
jgi:asparagine synthase (glutamine-hydrolysing)